MNYTDDQLKQALAKMLPNVIVIFTVEHSPEIVLVEKQTGAQYRDTELLHLCWMVEEMLEPLQKYDMEQTTFWHATWQQRTVALAKVKGVEIV